MDEQQIKTTDYGRFWGKFQQLVRERVIPYQWRAMNDEIPGAPKSNSVRNFRLAARTEAGRYEGMVFQDSDLYKWLEAVGNILDDSVPATAPVRTWLDEVVVLIADAQLDDGYLNTYSIVNDSARQWSNLRDAHELYCAGHLIEAAVSLSSTAGDTRLLEVARRFADLIDATFGVEEGKRRGYPGHEEIELALIKLYRHTGEKRYLERARYFIEERGRTPYFTAEAKKPGFVPIFGAHNLAYYQAHRPVREQTEAVGHAVRAMYLYCGAADLAQETGDGELLAVCDRLWESATSRKMYVTGGVGSSWVHESFGADFDLPNDSAYAETCASIGLFLFSSRMLRLHHEAKYADVMERCLYNGILSGLSLDGESYFYVNPLEVDPRVCDENPSYEVVKYRRQAWYGCACCPPNIARTLTGLGHHLYHTSGSILYVDLFHEATAEVPLAGGQLTLRQTTDYPWSGKLTLELVAISEQKRELTVAVRKPEWCRRRPVVSVNGSVVDAEIGENGYLHLRRSWAPGDRVELELPMQTERVRADDRVRADFGKVAVQRGPVVYCLEEADNGPQLHSLRLPADAPLEAVERPDLLGGIIAITATGETTRRTGDATTAAEGHRLYESTGNDRGVAAVPLLFIPYFTWANRAPGEMLVWVRE